MVSSLETSYQPPSRVYSSLSVVSCLLGRKLLCLSVRVTVHDRHLIHTTIMYNLELDISCHQFYKAATTTTILALVNFASLSHSVSIAPVALGYSHLSTARTTSISDQYHKIARVMHRSLYRLPHALNVRDLARTQAAAATSMGP